MELWALNGDWCGYRYTITPQCRGSVTNKQRVNKETGFTLAFLV